MSREDKVAQISKLIAEVKDLDGTKCPPTPQAVKDALADLEGAPRKMTLKEKMAATMATAMELLGAEHTIMLCEQPSMQELRKAARTAPPALAPKLLEIADNAEFELLYYAVTVHKGFEVAQKEFRKYARMEEQRLRAFEPAIREYDDRYDPKDRRMGLSLKFAVDLARDAAKLYLVDGKMVSRNVG